jgi:branched-subunit amino acid transport protein
MIVFDNAWPAILFLGIGTFLIRYSFMPAMDRISRTETLSRLLKPIPAAVLAALVVPAILTSGGELSLYSNPRLLPGLIAAAVAWKTRNILLTITTGMVALWLQGML